MPYEVDSPLGVGLSTAAAFLTGREQRRQQKLAEQQQAELARQEAGLKAAQSKYYEAGATEREAQANKLIQMLPYLPQEEAIKVAGLVLKGDLTQAQIAAQQALSGYRQAQAGYTQQRSSLTKQQTKKAAIDAATEQALRQSQIFRNMRVPAGRGGGGGRGRATTGRTAQGFDPVAYAQRLMIQQFIKSAAPTQPRGGMSFQTKFDHFMKMSPAEQKAAILSGYFTAQEAQQILQASQGQ